MGHLKANRVTAALLFSAILAVTAPVQAVDSDLYLAGLGLHQETGRNIYLGGIYLEREAPKPANLTEASGTRIMEYRVVARRTSIRSLLGGMLLQSEVATGKPADKATADFIDDILSVVNTSLYAGDSLEIGLTDDNHTIASLNGHELARVKNKAVADYLLMGWVGESGPSTSFRQHITAGEVDPSLLVELEANTYTAQREAEIAEWLGIEEEEPEAEKVEEVVADAEEKGAEKTPEEQPETIVAEAATEESVETPAVEVAVAAAAVASDSDSVVSVTDVTPSDEAAPLLEGEGDEPVQVAALMPAEDIMPTNTLESEVQALGIQEYSQRLATFHTQMVRMVYGEIRYPKRAVRRGLEGRMELDVTLNADGQILGIALAAPSGHKMLDEAAMEAAQDAFGKKLRIAVDPVAIAEFGDFQSNEMTIPVPVAFRLQ